MDLVADAGFCPVNVDATVIAQAPKLSPNFPAIREVLGTILGLSCDRIGVKATTNEGLRAWGHDEGIAAMAVCLIETA